MSEAESNHGAVVRWKRSGQPFANATYSRNHAWSFDGGTEVRASAAAVNVPRGTSDPSAVDPEEGFVASVASCHMLWFLSIAAARGFIVERYEDRAEGAIMPLAGAPRRKVLGRIVLRPAVAFDVGSPCSDADLAALHEEAHRECFLANALGPSCCLTIEPRPPSEIGPY